MLPSDSTRQAQLEHMLRSASKATVRLTARRSTFCHPHQRLCFDRSSTLDLPQQGARPSSRNLAISHPAGQLSSDGGRQWAWDQFGTHWNCHSWQHSKSNGSTCWTCTLCHPRGNKWQFCHGKVLWIWLTAWWNQFEYYKRLSSKCYSAIHVNADVLCKRFPYRIIFHICSTMCSNMGQLDKTLRFGDHKCYCRRRDSLHYNADFYVMLILIVHALLLLLQPYG